MTGKPKTPLGAAIAALIYAGFGAREAAADTRDDVLQEIVVTARKRAENLQDVPQNIDVFTARDLNNLGIVRLENFSMLAPSISIISTGPVGQRFFIRGASDGSTPNFGFGTTWSASRC
jgi:iron complex outermembrane recepter protein